MQYNQILVLVRINFINTTIFISTMFPDAHDIDMKLTPLIKGREINLLLLSYLSCDVT